MGSKFLKVTGILMIIFGSIALIIAIVALLGLGVLEAMGAPMGLLWASGIIALLGAVAEFIAGIIGVVNWNKPNKANTCIGWGIAVVAMCVISNIFTLIGYPENFNVFSLLTGLVIPVLYLIGAFKNKKLG
jgi:peptidoglycan/LPS O-acetylase OafA/YrhL